MADPITRFMQLFVGNARSFGRFYPERDRQQMTTTKAPYAYENFRQHLQGKIGIGIVPILDDGTCRFAAIDIDAHKDNDIAIDVAGLSIRIEAKGLPLVVCKSKGKGAHLYAFFSEPVSAVAARGAMQRWAQELGHPGVEIFPKQTALPIDRNTNERAYGQWINLPYFGTDTRVCYEGGSEVGLELFLDIAESKRMDASRFANESFSDHAQAPPCVQRMLAEGVEGGQGVSNNALYNATVYFKRAFPEDYRERARDFNATILRRPRDRAEAARTINSASAREYSYKCKEEPIKSLCDRQACLLRKYGVAIGEDDDQPEIEFTAMMKLATFPPRWQLNVGGVPMSFTTGELHSFPHVRQRIFEVHHIWPKTMTQKEWESKLSHLAKEVQVIEAPPDVSKPGMIRARLMQYLAKAGPDDGGDKRQQFGASTRPQPTWISYEGKEIPNGRYIIFDFGEFKEFLRKNKVDDVREGPELHYLMRTHCGCNSVRIKIGNVPRTVQAVPSTVIAQYEGAAQLPDSDL